MSKTFTEEQVKEIIWSTCGEMEEEARKQYLNGWNDCYETFLKGFNHNKKTDGLDKCYKRPSRDDFFNLMCCPWSSKND